MRRQLVLLLALACTACAGKPFNVKVVPHVEPEAISAPSLAGPLSVRASAVWDEDWLLETFDANTILAGVLPVRVEIENRGREPLATKKLEVAASDGAGRRFELLDASKARKAIETYYELTIRSSTGDKLYKQDWAANALDLKTALAPGERRQGFVFLRIPPDVDGRVALRFTVASKRDAARVEVTLD